MNRRELLKGLLAIGVSPTLIPNVIQSVTIKREPPKGDRIVKIELKPLTNIGIGDDDMLCGNEESLQFERRLYIVDGDGHETFLKVLSDEEYGNISSVIRGCAE